VGGGGILAEVGAKSKDGLTLENPSFMVDKRGLSSEGYSVTVSRSSSRAPRHLAFELAGMSVRAVELSLEFMERGDDRLGRRFLV
jgi:hypothetical protein